MHIAYYHIHALGDCEFCLDALKLIQDNGYEYVLTLYDKSPNAKYLLLTFIILVNVNLSPTFKLFIIVLSIWICRVLFMIDNALLFSLYIFGIIL